MYIVSFIKPDSAIQKLMGVGGTQAHRQHGNHISLLLFFQKKESGLIKKEKEMNKGQKIKQ
jgi:hypothetical protein